MFEKEHIRIDITDFDRFIDVIQAAVNMQQGIYARLGSVEEKLCTLIRKEDQIMDAITAFVANVQASFDAANASLETIKTGITALDAEIQAFQNSPGTLSATDQASLDSIASKAAALAAAMAAVNLTPPPAPPAV